MSRPLRANRCSWPPPICVGRRHGFGAGVSTGCRSGATLPAAPTQSGRGRAGRPGGRPSRGGRYVFSGSVSSGRLDSLSLSHLDSDDGGTAGRGLHRSFRCVRRCVGISSIQRPISPALHHRTGALYRQNWSKLFAPPFGKDRQRISGPVHGVFLRAWGIRFGRVVHPMIVQGRTVMGFISQTARKGVAWDCFVNGPEGGLHGVIS